MTKELQCQEGTSGIVKYDCAIYFPRTCLGFYNFLGINFLSADNESNYCLEENCLNIKFTLLILKIKNIYSYGLKIFNLNVQFFWVALCIIVPHTVFARSDTIEKKGTQEMWLLIIFFSASLYLELLRMWNCEPSAESSFATLISFNSLRNNWNTYNHIETITLKYFHTIFSYFFMSFHNK